MSKLSIKDFWNASIGTWEQIKEIPSGFHHFAKSSNSEYYTNKEETVICRISDHWGSGIRECNWYLKGFPRNNSFLFKGKNEGKRFIGIIKLKDLIDISTL